MIILIFISLLLTASSTDRNTADGGVGGDVGHKASRSS